MRIVIIGNSATAVGAIESIREHDQSAEITVISDEGPMIYSRPMLSHYLAGEIDRARLAYRPSDFWTRHNVAVIADDAVVSIDPVGHSVETNSGRVIGYDRLLIATGGQPIVPPLPGLDLDGVFTFTRQGDATQLSRFLEGVNSPRALVVGGGMIGIKATDSLWKRGAHVTMVELAPMILAAALDGPASEMVCRLLRENGVDVRTENTVTEIHGEDGRVRYATLKDASTVECDVVVFGIGVRPNSGLANAAGLKVNRGICVDEFMRSSNPHIYAAGDVAEAYDLVVDMNRTVAIWPNAYRQGAIAGAHMVGIERPDPGGVAMNTVEVMGVPAMSIGNGNAPEEGHDVLVRLDESANVYRRLVLREGRLVGAILVGEIDRAGIYTGLIRNRIDVGQQRQRLLDGHMSLLSTPEQYRKHVVRGAGIEV
ncbi:MAG: NAD(P)/FAD-dependent oxidoreductase [Chloroflexi bacterium]|nr:NAD(P)/FAD-dependent oxidoreductase [Chloroflexota bacterium]